MNRIQEAAAKRRDADALRAIAARAGDSDHLLDARAGRFEEEADALSWSWQVDASELAEGGAIIVTIFSKIESRVSSLAVPADRARLIAEAVLATVDHPSIVEALRPVALCPQPGCDMPAGHAGEHDTIPF